jgi:thiazolylpeptide-type bacteriocin precursor
MTDVIQIVRCVGGGRESINTKDFADTFASFDIADLEVLEVSAGTALPEMGASQGGYVTCSSSSSSSCC